MIKHLYYKIFVSCMDTVKHSSYLYDIWQIMSLFGVSTAMLLNTFFIWLCLPNKLWFSDRMVIEFIPGYRFNGALSFLLYVYVPIIIMNYFLIFYKKKYVQILNNYPEAKNKKISGIYFGISWFGLLIFFIIFMQF